KATTLAPSAAKPRARARPIPRLAPVTRTTFPCRIMAMQPPMCVLMTALKPMEFVTLLDCSRPNATAQPCPEAGATQGRRLEAVRGKALIMIEAPSSAYRRGMLVVGKAPRRGGDLMRFYTQQHPFYCGIDLHASTMYVCILHQEGEILVHRHMPAGPEPFLKTIAPYREHVVVCVACIFPWYWLADRCAREGMPCVLGHALSRKAIHGGQANNDRIDAPKIAVLLRGGMLPQAYVYPAAMRATRDLLRRRRHLMRKRAARLAHIHNTKRQYTLPEIG